MTTPFGRPDLRKEDQRFITGRGRYVDDLRVPGCLHAAFVRSPYAHARVERIAPPARGLPAGGSITPRPAECKGPISAANRARSFAAHPVGCRGPMFAKRRVWRWASPRPDLAPMPEAVEVDYSPCPAAAGGRGERARSAGVFAHGDNVRGVVAPRWRSPRLAGDVVVEEEGLARVVGAPLEPRGS